jgi:23S rRNA (guanosine2251-2'-O)-methyltransferase
MVGQRRRSARRKPLAGNHQKSWLWGRNAVLETLDAGRWIPLELVLSDSADPDLTSRIRDFAEALDVPLQTASHDRLTELGHARDHQGVLAKLPAYPFSTLDDMLEQAGDPGLFVVLDSIQDPFNFGSVCRVACVYGADGVVIGSRDQADVTPHVARSSAGAVSRLDIAQVDDLASALADLNTKEVRIIGTAPQADRRIDQSDLTGSVAIIIGNEGRGLGEPLAQACDELVRIPQAASFDSLNAAVSAGILCYEIHRQRSLPV